MSAGLIGGALGLAAAKFGTGIASQFLSYENNKKLQENQAKLNYKYAEKTARNTPTWNRAGLENAGYNPMLAVQNSTSGVNSSWTSANNTSPPDLDISSSISNAQSFQRLRNETIAAEASARNQNAEAYSRELSNPFVPERIRSDIAKVNAETSGINANIENLKARLELDRTLGFAGLDVQRRGQDKVYNASTFASDVSGGRFGGFGFTGNIHTFSKWYNEFFKGLK